MKIRLSLLMLAMSLVLFFLPHDSAACPKCFASMTKQVLQAYYVSIVFMALIPVSIVVSILTWIRRQSRRHPLGEKNFTAASRIS